jgi:hypothetical protein
MRHGIYMASDETHDIALSLKEMKKKAKQQKKAKKKDKKKHKLEKKIAKKEAKMRKKGVFLDDLTTTTEDEVEVVEVDETFEEKQWVRKSTDDIPLLEKKIDMMTDRKEKSDLHSLFEERFGESLMVPATYQEYELTESEKRRLEAIRAVEVEPEPEPVEEAKIEAAPAESKGLFKRSKKKGAAEGEVVEEGEVAKPELKPIYYPFQPYIYKKYAPGKHKVVQILLLIISGLLLILSLPFRLIIWIFVMIFKTIGSKRKAKKEKKSEAPSEA